MDITLIPDDELKRLAEIDGPKGAAAFILRKVIVKRRKDRQVYAWRIGSYYFVGPVPDATTEAQMVEVASEDEDDD